eukprot:g5492.t1
MRYGTPLASSASKAALLMSSAGGDDPPLVFPRSMLKKGKLEIPNRMGVGTMAWGDEKVGFVSDPKYKPKDGEFNPADLQGAFNTLMNAGITFFDTSDVYGYKSTKLGFSAEQLLGRFAEETGRPLVAAKYMPILWTRILIGGPWRAGRRAVAKALTATLERGGWAYVDLYQVHFPFPYFGGMDALAEGLSKACDRGLCRSVGVSNFNAKQMREFSEKLGKYGITLASNQFEYSLVNRDAEADGTLAECKRLGVVPLAHTPLAKGLATGIYTASNPTGGKMGAPKYVFKDLFPLTPVHTALVAVAKRVEGRLSVEAKEEQKRAFEALGDDEEQAPPPKPRKISTTQVALNYVRAKGIVPLPGVKTKAHADEIVGCLGWELVQEDVDILDSAHDAYKASTGGKTIKRGRERDPMKRQALTLRKTRAPGCSKVVTCPLPGSCYTMPRQVTRALDLLKQPVRKAVLSGGLDRDILEDDSLITGLSELQTKQAIKVLDTYCANVQRQGSGRIQNKAAYLMSLIQSYKLGPASGTTGSAQRLMERLSPAVSQAVQAVFDPVVDRVVLEDRALMELLAKVPEDQALAALKKYRATVQRRGRDAIENRCGYLIGFLKQYQDGVAVVGVPGNALHQSRNASTSSSNGDGQGQHFANGPSNQSSSTGNGHNPHANGGRGGAMNGADSSAQGGAAARNGGLGGANASGVRPISYLQAPVRKELEKLFESGRDKTVLEDVGLIKQLSRLGEEQALAALRNYKEASKHRRDIHNKSAYLMGILRGYIEGTTPISKAPWETGGNDDGSSARTSTPPAPPSASASAGSRVRGRVRGSGPGADDAERSAASSLSKSNSTTAPPPPPPQQQQQQQQQQRAMPPDGAPPAGVAPSLTSSGPRELGGVVSTPVPSEQQPPPPPPTAPLASPLLRGDGRFLGGIGHSGAGGDSSQHQHQRQHDPSNSLSYLDGSGSGAHQQPLRHNSPHESLFGSHLSANPGRQQQTLIGPGLLGGDFLSTGGGGAPPPPVPAAAAQSGGPGAVSNPGLFGSGLLGGVDFGSCSTGSHGNLAVPASPGSGSGLGSTSGLGSSFLSGAGSGAESPNSSDAGNDTSGTLASSTTAASSLSVAGSSSCNGSTDWPSSSSPGSGEGRENDSSNGNGVVSGVVDMLERLNLSKYVPVLAEAEVDLDALRLFGENDLKDLGFPKGPRIKLLHEVQNLNFPARA